MDLIVSRWRKFSDSGSISSCSVSKPNSPRSSQRGAAATEKKNGRKERKGRKKESGVVGAGLNPTSRIWRIEKFAQAAQIITDSSTKDTKDSDDQISELRTLRDLVVKTSFLLWLLLRRARYRRVKI